MMAYRRKLNPSSLCSLRCASEGVFAFYILPMHPILKICNRSSLVLICNCKGISYSNERMGLFFKHNFCVKPYVPREPRRDPSNRRLNEHGIYIYISDTARNRTHNLSVPSGSRYH